MAGDKALTPNPLSQCWERGQSVSPHSVCFALFLPSPSYWERGRG